KRQSIRQVFGKYRPRCAQDGAGIVGARAGRQVGRGAAYPCVPRRNSTGHPPRQPSSTVTRKGLMVFCCTRLASQARQSISNQKSDMPSPLCGFLLHTSEGFGKHALSVTLSGKGGSPMPPTVRMLKSAAWGAGGRLARRNALKSQEGYCLFLKLQK